MLTIGLFVVGACVVTQHFGTSPYNGDSQVLSKQT